MKIKLIILALFASLALPLSAKDDEFFEALLKSYDEFDHYTDNFDANLEFPPVPKKEKGEVKKYMKRLREDLEKKGYRVQTVRSDEVLLVTLPLGDLFLPNETTLWQGRSSRKLDPLKPFFEDPNMFKILFIVNSDNTGSQDYNLDLSEQRADAFIAWIESFAHEDLVITDYAAGDQDPVEPNNTYTGRAANRRVEFYFIPGPQLINLAHQKKLPK